MAVTDLLSEIVDPKVKQELSDLRRDVKETVDTIIEGSKKTQGAFSGISMSKDLSEMLKAVNGVADAQKKTNDQINKLADSYKKQMEDQKLATEESKKALNVEKALTEERKQDTENLRQWTEVSKQATEQTRKDTLEKVANAKASTEESKKKLIELNYTEAIEKKKESVAKQMEKEAANTARLQGAYYELNKEYKEAAINAKNLGAQQEMLERDIRELNNIKAPSEQITLAQKKIELERLAPILKTAQANAMGLHTSLLKVDQAVGQSQRNVGNYNGALMAMTQMLREAPSFANSFATGIMAISNNFPILIDEIQKLRAVNAQVVAAGGAATPVWKTLAGAFTSFGGAMTIAMTVMTFLAPAIGGLFKSADKASESVKKLKESIQSIDENAFAGAAKSAAQLEVLNKVVKDTAKSESDRAAAIKEMQKIAPEQLGNLKDEAFLYGDITKEIDAATKALYKKAAAEAAMEKFKETYKADYLLLQEQRKAQDELTAAKARYERLQAASASNSVAASKEFQAAEGVGEQIKRIQKGIDATQKQRDKLQKEMAAYSKDAEAAWTAMAPPAAMDGSIAKLQEDITKLSAKREKQINTTTAAGRAENENILHQIEVLQKLIDVLNGKGSEKTGNTILKGINELFEANKRYEQAIVEQKKQEFELSAAKNKAIFDDDTKSLQDRLDAHTLYQQDLEILSKLEAAKEIAIIDDKLKALNDKLAGNQKKGEGHIVLNADQLASIEKDLVTYGIMRETALKNQTVKEGQIVANGINTVEGIRRSSQTHELQELNKHLGAEAAALQEYLGELDDNYNKEATIIANKYLKHEIGEGKFQDELRKLKNRYEAISLGERIQADEELLKHTDLTADKEIEIRRRLNKEKNALVNNAIEGAGQQKKNNPFGLDNSAYDDAVKVANAGMDLYAEITKAMNARYQTEIDQIQKRRDAIAASAQAEIDGINQSSLSAEEKEKRIASAKEQAALKDKELMKQQNAMKRQQAINDKAANIAAIVQKMALAIATAFTAGPVIGQVLAGITATILGVQLAQAIATPIPEYKDGTGNRPHPGGLARYGEAGPELVLEPGKAPYIADTDTIGILGAGTHVIPLRDRIAEMKRLIGNGMSVDADGVLRGFALREPQGDRGGHDSFLMELKRLRADMNNKAVPMIVAQNGELRLVDVRRNGRTVYVGKRFA